MTNTTQFQSRAIFAAFLVLILPAAAQAEGSGCSLSRAAATWIFTDNGTVIGVGPRTAVGKFTLTPTGLLLNGVGTSSLNGAIAEETFDGTFTVNPDCTGTVSVGIFSGGIELFTVTANLVFDRKMEHMHALFTSVVPPGKAPLLTVIALDGRRD